MLFYISNLNSSCILNKEYERTKENNKKRRYDHLHYPRNEKKNKQKLIHARLVDAYMSSYVGDQEMMTRFIGPLGHTPVVQFSTSSPFRFV